MEMFRANRFLESIDYLQKAALSQEDKIKIMAYKTLGIIHQCMEEDSNAVGAF